MLVLENDGSVLATAITAAGLALMDGCIPMYDVIVAASLVCYFLIYWRLIIAQKYTLFSMGMVENLSLLPLKSKFNFKITT